MGLTCTKERGIHLIGEIWLPTFTSHTLQRRCGLLKVFGVHATICDAVECLNKGHVWEVVLSGVSRPNCSYCPLHVGRLSNSEWTLTGPN